jgi:diguanylate cyclase (GGDEF)-like protein
MWLFALIMVGATVMIYVEGALSFGPPAVAVDIPWWSIAGLYCLAGLFVVRFQYVRESVSFSLIEVPLVLGLFFLTPGELLMAALLGSLVAGGLYWKQPPLKLFFNVARSSLEVAIAVLVFHMVVSLGEPFGPAGWAAALLATLAADVLSTVTSTVAVVLTEGRPDKLPPVFGVSAATTFTNTCLALVSVILISDRPSAAWLSAVLWFMTFIGYRAYGSVRQNHESMELLYESSRAGSALHVESVLVQLLSQAREMFRCEIAEITMLPQQDGEPALRTALGPGGSKVVLQPLEIDSSRGAWGRVMAQDEALLLPRPIKTSRFRTFFMEPNITDAMVAPLRADGRSLGVMLVANRLGNFGTFDDDDLRLFETLINHTSTSLENGRLVDHLRRQAAQNEHLALHDRLTGLPNRALFQEAVRHAVVAAKREMNSAVVMLMDLDRFKEINDTLGHHYGDLLLQEVAERLRTCLRESDMVSRLGGDEFAILLPVVADSDAAMVTARKVLESLEIPVELEGISVEIGASIGIAMYPHDGDDPESLLQRADVAMYLAKDSHTGCEVYSSERDGYRIDRLGLVSELRRAIDNEELKLLYQPKVDLRTGRVLGFEALMRWMHPTRGFISPDDFVQIAEHAGLIRPLTTFALNSALRHCATWTHDGLGPHVSVNVSARSLLDASFPDEIAVLLNRWHVPPELLQLEINGTSITADPERSREILERLSAMGVRLSIDDFGRGSSSLSHIKRLPVHEIKIDRSFVMGMQSDQNDAVIVRSIVDLGHTLGMKVVAEGVESREILDALVSLGCDVAQGFYLARPLPPERLMEWSEGFQLLPPTEDDSGSRPHPLFAVDDKVVPLARRSREA